MRLLRETIRKIILESIHSKYESLASMLDSYDVSQVQPAIELLVAPDADAGGEPYAEIISHEIVKGNSPMAQISRTRQSSISTQGPVGKSRLQDDPCFHKFQIRFNQSFLDYMKQTQPTNMFLQSDVDSYEPTMIFAEAANETWSQVCEKYNLSKRELSVEIPTR